MDSNEHVPSHPAHAAPSNKTLMAALAYIGPLVVVSYIVAQGDPFVKFHIRQGLVLLVIEVIVWFLGAFFGMLFYPFWMLLNLVDLAVLVLAVLGVINAVQGKEKELPIVGGFGRDFPI